MTACRPCSGLLARQDLPAFAMCAATTSPSMRHLLQAQVFASALAEREGGAAALHALRAAGCDVRSGLPGGTVAERAGGCFDGVVAVLGLSEAFAAAGDAVAALRRRGPVIVLGLAGVMHDSEQERAALKRGADFF